MTWSCISDAKVKLGELFHQNTSAFSGDSINRSLGLTFYVAHRFWWNTDHDWDTNLESSKTILSEQVELLFIVFGQFLKTPASAAMFSACIKNQSDHENYVMNCSTQLHIAEGVVATLSDERVPRSKISLLFDNDMDERTLR